MRTEEMRKQLSDTYPAEKWRNKVKKMSDAQVFALYTKFKQQGKVK